MSTISRQQVCDAIRLLGFDPEDVSSVAIDAHRVEAVLFDRNEGGDRYLIPEVAGRYGEGDAVSYAKRHVYLPLN